MLTNPTILILALGLFGCLPPPHAWPEADEATGGGDVDTASDSGDDTATPTLACSSIEFGPSGHLSIESGDLGESRSFYTNEDFTIEFYAWFPDIDLSVDRALVSYGNQPSWSVEINDGDLIFRANALEIRGPAPQPQQDWTHVAVVKDDDPGEIRMYVNGSLFSEVLPFGGSFSVPEAGGDVLHVGRAQGFEKSWESGMDEVRFADQALYFGAAIEPKDPLDRFPWLGVWHFSEDVSNALSDNSEAAGSGYTFNPTCPFR